MHRRKFLTLAASSLAGCAYLRIDPWSYLIRSDVIDSPEKEALVLQKAKLGWSEDGKIRVLETNGTPYEIGYQHGVLLRKEIQDNIGFLFDSAVDKFHFEELFDECYERMRPFIPQDYIDEMHGLAHGSRLPLKVIHGIHALPEIGEWGGKKRIAKVIKQMMSGELGTSCSNLSASSFATKDGRMYTVRILDWGLHRISRLHQYPLIHICNPIGAIPFINIGWIGFIGAISGINKEGITLGEMGYGDIPNETLHGTPMPFLLREVLAKAKNLSNVRNIIKSNPGTNSFVFLMSDGKTKEAEMYIRDRERFLVFKAGEKVVDRKNNILPIKNIVFGGHYGDKMQNILTQKYGEINPEILMKEIIPAIAMPSNFQNVIYSPDNLEFWVANAKSKSERAAEMEYTHFKW